MEKYFDVKALNGIIDTCNRSEILTLLTVTSCIEKSACGTTTLEKYLGSEFP